MHILSAVKYKHHRKGQMGYCSKGTENCQCGNQNNHVCSVNLIVAPCNEG